MKAVLGVFLVVAVWTTVNAQTTSDREQDRLFGAVQSLKTEVAEFTKDGKSAEGRRMPVQEVSYDARGNKIKRVDFSRDGSVAQTLVYTYDAAGRSTGYEDYTPDLSAPRKHVYVLDQDGNKVEYSIVQPDGSAGEEKYLYKYDANGNRIAEELYHKTTLISRTENVYDSRGRMISQFIYNPDDTIAARVHKSIAADGKPIEQTRYDGDHLTYRVRFKYDSRGRLLERETTGSYVDTTSDTDPYVTGSVVYVYKNKDRRPKEALTYNQDGSLRERVAIDYDSRGNWTRRTRHIQTATGKEEPVQVEYRTITYD